MHQMPRGQKVPLAAETLGAWLAAPNICKGLKTPSLHLLGNPAAQTPPEWSHYSLAEAGH